MALQTINVGYFVNDGSGDDLRTAFVKVNENFDELDLRSGQNNTASNAGTGIGLFKEKVGVDLRFKSLIAGTNIVITQSVNNNEITISNTGAITVAGTAPVNPVSGKLWYDSQSGRMYVYYDSYWVDANPSPRSYSLADDVEPTLNADLNLNGNNIVGEGEINGTFVGTSTGAHNGLVYGIDIRDLNGIVNGFDFGPIIQIYPRTLLELLLAQQDFDLGSFASPSTIEIDLGTFV